MNGFKAYLKTLWSKNFQKKTSPESVCTNDVVNPSIRESLYLEAEIFEAVAMPIARLNGSHPQYYLNLRNDHKHPDERVPDLEKPLPEIPKLAGVVQSSPQWEPWRSLATSPTHARAIRALKKRYEDKFASSFDVGKYPGLSVGGLENRVMSHEDLEKRVLCDITWVRDHYQYAKLDEPSDQDIIWWYDAERYDTEAGAAGQSTKAGDLASRKQFLGGLMYSDFQFSKSTPY